MAFIYDFAYINEKRNIFGKGGYRYNVPDKELTENNFLTAIYRLCEFSYPKFFKMDNLSKAGFLASELLVDELDENFDRKDCGVILFNRVSSLTTDKNFENTIKDSENFYPSPALFVYTLPNIVTGEICIRQKFYGESSFYVMEDFDTQRIVDIISDSLQQNKYVMTGWIDETDEGVKALMFLVTRDSLYNTWIPFTVEAIEDMRKLTVL